MNAKYLVVGTFAGGIVLFLGAAVAHSVLPQPLRSFQNEQVLLEAVRASAPSNGVYLSTRGLFAAVALDPDLHDKAVNLAPNLLRQLAGDTLAALFLAILVVQLPGGAISKSIWAALAGMVAFLLKIVPYWNWYGFSPAFIGMEALDLVGKFFIGALLLGVLHKKLVPQKTEAPNDPRSSFRGHS